jgi:hypothetical protein
VQHQLPAGYASAEPMPDSPSSLRIHWSQKTEVEWGPDHELKWTAAELVMRAELAEAATAELIADLGVPLERMYPSQRREEWVKLQRRLEQVHRKIGVKGRPPFAGLSYFR